MRRLSLVTLLPLVLLAACQNTPSDTGDGQRNRPCPPRLQEAGKCGTAGSLSSFPELSNVN